MNECYDSTTSPLKYFYLTLMFVSLYVCVAVRMCECLYVCASIVNCWTSKIPLTPKLLVCLYQYSWFLSKIKRQWINGRRFMEKYLRFNGILVLFSVLTYWIEENFNDRNVWNVWNCIYQQVLLIRLIFRKIFILSYQDYSNALYIFVCKISSCTDQTNWWITFYWVVKYLVSKRLSFFSTKFLIKK